MTKSALICGVSGQDGAYLAEFLLNKGYEVWGTSRDKDASKFDKLTALGILEKINLLSMAPDEFQSVISAIQSSLPDEIYYLAGQSSVGLSFELPAETMKSFVLGTLNILEAVRLVNKKIRIYHAGSSECFGDTGGKRANEETRFHPQSPYGVAKASATLMIANYREAYDLFACTGILFNHESPLRPKRFVTQKVIAAAKRIGEGSDERVQLGRLDIYRDWGWAPEYVEAMWLMLQCNHPQDFVIATGQTYSLEVFVQTAFDLIGKDWKEHVDVDQNLFRPSEIGYSYADPTRAATVLNWRAQSSMKDVIEKMILLTHDG